MSDVIPFPRRPAASPSDDDAPSSAEGAVVGIDLGTTYSLVAVMRGERPVVLSNGIGEQLTASAVSFDEDGSVLVGAAAKARQASHPDRTAVTFKRDMGTEKTRTLAGKTMRPQELSALVLEQLKRDAEAELGMPVVEAVVTVPAYFGDLQRQATRDAAEIAGLKVERIINEPTAAAMAYGLHQRDRELQAVVLDLGGGTFDVTVLEIIEGVIEIQSTAGDARLGGEDFAEALAEKLAEELAAEHGADPREDERAWARLLDAAEHAKRRLTTSTEAAMVVPGLRLGEAEVDVERALTRDEAEAIWQPLLARLKTPILRALRDAELEAGDVEEVLLVGGATRMPCVVDLGAKLFGKMPLSSLPADEAVAMGAAVQAALKKGHEAVDDMVVTDVAPFSMGIATASLMGRQQVEGLYTPVLERGTTIPASRVQRFFTMGDGQKEIRVAVYQGEHSLCKDNTRLGEYVVKDLPNESAGKVAIDVRFTYDLNGILEVEMTLVGTERVEHMVIERTPGRLSAEEIAAAREAMKAYKFHPRDTLPNRTALARADQLFTELTGVARDELGHAIAVFRSALETQDPKIIVRVRDQLGALVDALRRAHR
ncbi:MAG TPA: Hsp70 family protein [Polyangiaceae bacterium LLY-WYZ-15_(1-7)]|nr:molecular chaperone HscC [Myxococcales bacterium]MAT24400.1 molecular chaperone HscC [Sandaracinus sp.]HJK92828.1 Hsp70 family protein [Polyangiaceae bacterium LLY-WYZ-15_(1-7)]MBJ70319.1 molecular chaperone HscC [Sandaracinus sp.]HJL04903.1 Hsp70 family protein [Polyangiaceae bacterium LLY-WYZ-15_(1-7)]